MSVAFHGGAFSLAWFVEFRKQFAEVHPSDKVRFHNQIGKVPEAVAIGFLQPASVRVGYPHMRYAEVEILGNLRQHVARPVIRGHDLNNQVRRSSEDGLGRRTWLLR